MRPIATARLYGSVFGRVPLLFLVGTLVLLPVACDNGDDDEASSSVGGYVTDPAGDVVAQATVYLIPASAIDTTPFDAQDVLDVTVAGEGAEAFDEPLEDLIDSSAASEFPHARTQDNGSYRIDGVEEGTYFFFVKPHITDDEHLPGGDICRVARHTDTFLGTEVNIQVSGATPGDAGFVGSTECLSCHEEYEAEKYHAHRLGISVPGQLSALQSLDRHPDFNAGLEKFTEASDWSDPGVTKLFFEAYDSSRGFDKFKVYEGTTGGGTVYFHVYPWKDQATGEYKLTLENVINPDDPGSPATFTVELTYGGALFKQRYLIAVTGREGLYSFLQYQSEGDNARYERTRWVFRDYHADWLWDSGTLRFKAPPLSKEFEGSCGACHFTGWTGGPVDPEADPKATEWLADAIDDPNGEYDIDGDGTLDEINTGCENCHGAGSRHVADGEGRYIISPKDLSPSRATMICGRCHDRIVGAWALASDSPIDAENNMAPPGIRRADYLETYVSQKGPETGADIWDDDIHSKSHHQQYADHIKSTKYRNDEQLVACDDCHDSHGFSELRWGLLGDPDDPDSDLCQRCHAVDVSEHMLEYTGSVMNGPQARCADCHMPKTAKTGAGRYGLLLGAPTGGSSDAQIVYWENDISSHIYDVPSKFNAGILGKTPGQAMPVPYVNRCGTCHDASQLKYR
ncbi:MAG: cytochrome c3 family protein [Planctomycetota bacterium]